MNINLSGEDLKKIIAKHYNIDKDNINIEEIINVSIDVIGDSLQVLIPTPIKQG